MVSDEIHDGFRLADFQPFLCCFSVRLTCVVFLCCTQISLFICLLVLSGFLKLLIKLPHFRKIRSALWVLKCLAKGNATALLSLCSLFSPHEFTHTNNQIISKTGCGFGPNPEHSEGCRKLFRNKWRVIYLSIYLDPLSC